MKNLSALWSQLTSSNVNERHRSRSPSRQRRCASEGTQRHIGRSRSRSKRFLRRLISGRRQSSISSTSSCSSDSSHSTSTSSYYSPGSISSCSTLSFYDPQQRQRHHERRATSAAQIATTTQCAASPSRTTPSTPSTSLSAPYQHPKHCRCTICSLHHQLRSNESKFNFEFEAIKEESDENDELNKSSKFSSQQSKHQHRSRMDRIEPFQSPEQLNQFWQEPKEFLEIDENHSVQISVLSDQHPASLPAIGDYHNDDIDGRRSSASNFLRTHHLRSSCPPPTRRRSRRKSTTGERQLLGPESSASITGSTTGLVGSLYSKISSVRKSWLFSIFQPSNSKVKQSKWAKSDDFEAEFYDHHSELTESLVNRRSPLSFDLNGSVARTVHQMSPSPSEQLTRRTSSPLSTTATTTANITTNNNNKVVLRRPLRDTCLSSSAWPTKSPTSRPRPRSACLDTYMLRMRNGHFIEFSVDNENKDESCSIVSSTNHLTGDFFQGNYSHCGRLAPDDSSPSTHRFQRSNSTQVASSDYHNSHWHSSPVSGAARSTTGTDSGMTSTTCSVAPSLPVATSTNTNTNTTTANLSSLSSASVSSGSCVPAARLSDMSYSPPTSDTAIHLYWPAKNFTEVPFGTDQCAFDVIKYFLTSQLYATIGNSSRNSLRPVLPLPNYATIHAYALRLICRNLNPNDHYWLHPTQHVASFIEQNRSLLEKGWKLELRIRYIPSNLEELFKNDFVSFKFLYEQVLEDYLLMELSTNSILSSQDLIIELGCYEIRRTHPFLTPQGLEKNSNIEALENDLYKIFPANFLASTKSKHLRKLIKSKFKKIYQISREVAMFNFLNQISQFVSFRREVFHCSLGESSWRVPVDFMIGPDVGIAYFTSTSSPATVITKSFDMVEQVRVVSYSTMNRMTSERPETNEEYSGSSSKKILLNVQVKHEEDPLVISCSSFEMAQSMADLIDGYHRLVTNSCNSIWLNNHASDKSSSGSNYHSRKSSGQSSLKSNISEVIEPKRAQFEIISPQISSLSSDGSFSTDSDMKPNPQQNGDDPDYSNPTEACLEISRHKLRIDDLVGNGQFGDVHKGVYYKPLDSSKEESVPVAIKISRVQNNGALGKHDIYVADQKLLCEAERMSRLEHSNIIKLIGVCSSSPVYVVIELAEFGELRDFLQKHGPTLEHRRLIEYSFQIASAMAYLESRQFVHRDIAARNVLVFSFECVKLSDFGLSRYIEDNTYYMATNSKLPIKWMAPESINFRRFTTASDVWMFAVCMWEIFMLGKKPFQGVKNSDVIGLIECGDRLTKPSSRCPDSLYQLMLKCWRYEPERRPTFRFIKRKIYDVYQGELGLIGALARIDIVNDASMSSSSLSSLSTYDRSTSSTTSSLSRIHHEPYSKSVTDNLQLSRDKSSFSLNTSQSSILDPSKIKNILDEQRKQMEEDQRWLAQNEQNWTKSGLSSLSRSSENFSEPNSTATSIYEDADSEKFGEHQPPCAEHLYSLPNLKTKCFISGGGDGSYNSYKSTKSSPTSEEHSSNPSPCQPITTDDCGLSESLQQFFEHNQLTNAKVRQEMMKKVKCASADMDRKDDPVYWSTINVVNSVRHLLKGVEELNTTEYIDLVKNVGLELRNLLANVDLLLETLPKDLSFNITMAQKKLSAGMNDLVESMKKTITFSETPMEGAYKQHMLEVAYILVIDSKNLMDTLDEMRMKRRLDKKQAADGDNAKVDSSPIYANDVVKAS